MAAKKGRNKTGSDPELHVSWSAALRFSKYKETRNKRCSLASSPRGVAYRRTRNNSPKRDKVGSNRVTRSSPGAWLILRPDGCTWKPWGRLEAWRETGYSDELGYRFELFHDGVATEVYASSSISLKNGGSFVIDVTVGTNTADPGRSSDIYCRSTRRKREGFVMLASVEGVGKRRKPEVEVGATHVTCTEDAAAHVALAAAVDLSLDACKLFSHKLRKE
ncbi:unnamed protein product [Brassica rapa subsp. narinosa]|uniref:Uncharacterized protein n=1 Tax=Brassica campestris TaxID=3711 RepID=M4CC29_BRACM